MKPSFVLVFLVFYSLSTRGAPPPTAAPLPSVIVRAAKRTEISLPLSYPASVEARVHATILAESDGVIRKIHANLGQQVKAAQRLVTVQQTDPIYKFAPVSVITPVNGIVSEMIVSEGTLVIKGQKLASVTDPRNLKILIEIPAKDLAYIQRGAVGRLESAALTGTVDLTLVGVSPSIDQATGTASGELKADPKDIAKLRPGMVGKVSFKANAHAGYLVPEDALVIQQNQTFLRIVKDGVAKKVPVTVGMRLKGKAEIVKGIEEGEKVVERASGFITDGEAVKVEELKDEVEGTAI